MPSVNTYLIPADDWGGGLCSDSTPSAGSGAAGCPSSGAPRASEGRRGPRPSGQEKRSAPAPQEGDDQGEGDTSFWDTTNLQKQASFFWQ